MSCAARLALCVVCACQAQSVEEARTEEPPGPGVVADTPESPPSESAGVEPTATHRPAAMKPAAVPAMRTGALLELYDLGDQPTDRVRPLAPMQRPNFVRTVETLELSSSRDDFAPIEGAFLARWTGTLEAAPGDRLQVQAGGAIAVRIAGLESVQRPNSPNTEVLLELPPGERAFEILLVGDASHSRFVASRSGAGEPRPFPFAHRHVEPSTATGVKTVLLPLRRQSEIERDAVASIHPGFELADVRPAGFEEEILLLAPFGEGRLLVAGPADRGEVWLLTGLAQDDPNQRAAQRFAAGLEAVCGIAAVGERVFVLQRSELTELIDRDRDDVADEFRSLAGGWPLSPRGDPSDLTSAGDLLACSHREGILRVDISSGRWSIQPLSGWLTLGSGPDGRLSCSRRISPHAGSESLLLLAAEGEQELGLATLFGAEETLAVPAQLLWLEHGPHAGQWLVGDLTIPALERWSLDEVAGSVNLCRMRFGRGQGDLAQRWCASSDGTLFGTESWMKRIGDDGKLATTSLGRVVRLRPRGTAPLDLATVRAATGGLELEFNAPLARECGWEIENYALESWRRDEGTDLRGSPGHMLTVRSASVSEDRRKVALAIPGLEPASALHLSLVGPLRDGGGNPLWTREAWLSLAALPDNRPIDRREPPVVAANVVTSEETAQGWKLLFDGASTSGWHLHGEPGSTAGWAAVDGALARVGPGGDLVTDETFASFELELEWKVVPGGNSGVFFHVGDEHEWVWQTGPELQLLDNALHADGLNPYTSAGSNYALHAPPWDNTVPVGMWNRARLVVHGAHVEHWLNGEKLCEYELWSDDWKARVAASKFASMPDYGTLRAGRIALQDHGDAVWFRNVRIRALP